MTTPRLLVVDNAIDHTFYRPVEHWTRAAGFVPESVYAAGGEPLPEPGLHSHVVLSGSEDSIVTLSPWAETEARWLRRAITRGCRVLGSCWGHQLIARTLGGPACVRRAAMPEFGWLDISVEDPSQILPPRSLTSFVSHFDEVVDGSHPDLRVLARGRACAVHALRWGELPVWGIQAHPEIDAQTGTFFLQEARNKWPSHRTVLDDALAAGPRDSQSVAGIVERFLSV